MAPEKKGGSFLDPKTILAIVFCFGLMILWQNHLMKKYPEHYKKEAQKEVSEDGAKTTAGTDKQPRTSPSVLSAPGDIENTQPVNPTQTPETVSEVTLKYEDDLISFDISNYGLGFRNIVLKNYNDREGKRIKLSEASKTPLFASAWLNSTDPMIFELTKSSDTEFRGVAQYGNTRVEKSLKVDPETYTLNVETIVSGDRGQFVGLKNMFSEKFKIEEGTIPLIPSYDINGFYVHHGTTNDRVLFGLENEVTEGFSDVGVLSVDTHYFARSIVDDSKILPKAKVLFDGESYATGSLRYDFPAGRSDLKFNQKIYLGPKDRDILLAADARLGPVLDLGMFSFIGNPILDLLQFFHRIFGNWGIAIILMTLVVRILLLPFNIVSFKSMKKMQVIQPQLQALKEKYKDDREQLNQETMRLMKESGANPISGCLPMLLQFPVFIALFQVLGNAIELYQAPFYLWIDDLSKRDPYFVLPILMAVTMVLQQKFSPTTPDPTTKKAMMFVTIMFSALLIFYPSGLALYIFVGSLFSIIQQLILMRDTKAPEKQPVKVNA